MASNALQTIRIRHLLTLLKQVLLHTGDTAILQINVVKISCVIFLFVFKGINPGAPQATMTSDTDGKINDTENKNGKYIH